MSSPTTNVSNAGALRARFLERFGSGEASPRLFQAPGRVNLIGEHTDYNQGLVMPAAISRLTLIAARARADAKLHLVSGQIEGEAVADLRDLKPQGGWADYVFGVAAALQQRGCSLRGAELAISSEIPLGAGLSSSAALEIGAGLALLALAGYAPGPGRRPEPDLLLRLAQAGLQAEHEFVGTQCGIMDQSICAFARAGEAMLLDCRSLEREFVPLPSTCVLAICNTGVRHELAASEYNQRRQECEAAVAALQAFLPAVQSLRDLDQAELTRWGSRLPAVPRRRARHIVTENERVRQARAALIGGDLAALRDILAASHRSLRDDFEVSCPELDAMVAAAEEAPGFVAGRMTGGGFGGCTVNFVARDQAESFVAHVRATYHERMGTLPEIAVVTSADGASELDWTGVVAS